MGSILAGLGGGLTYDNMFVDDGDVYIDADTANLTCRFTDIYNQTYWTNPVWFE